MIEMLFSILPLIDCRKCLKCRKYQPDTLAYFEAPTREVCRDCQAETF